MKAENKSQEKIFSPPLDIIEAAQFLKLKPNYIYQLVFHGKLNAYKPGGKKLIFKKSDLEAYIYKNKVENKQEKAEKILNGKFLLGG